MSLSLEDVTRISRLARLELTPEKKEQTLNELNNILGLIEKLQSVDTTGVEPLAHPLSAHEDITLRLREDVITETSSESGRDALLANAPATENGLFLVPKVIE
ncbi:aspartyl/glutamyl-tRNA(Asn/Gln) amidotransferase subunit C [Advenella faeciporci]|uniref:Aspartyl/glutamyl-tRNA(Asn/Gln) amidotransferase subunit C n=1 Tax=Advenella faeciporci TaxID=797535 RepID=A0A918N1S6_9BURK|nr:Asp-tRNA(Asn)/Glu-tRNA(Gln) amidotransferase subunit GatC [Advenella faeciporci]GGW95138.1 aspartyl/glutamyl-tRNA(Asn/Gln) amidotransferase subunit C [Advenella faeciporci]